MSNRSIVIKAVLVAALIILMFVVVKNLRNYPPHSGNPPNVVIVVMDTVGQDHLACYGYHRNTNLNLIRLVASLRSFGNAYSTLPWT